MGNQEVLDNREVLHRLMQRYDEIFPMARPFAQDSARYEYRKTLDALAEAGLCVIEKPGIEDT